MNRFDLVCIILYAKEYNMENANVVDVLNDIKCNSSLTGCDVLTNTFWECYFRWQHGASFGTKLNKYFEQLDADLPF